jgi:hypothetical protein
MGTFFLSCAVDLSLNEMLEERMFEQYLSDPDEYAVFWRFVYEADDKKRAGTSSNRVGIPFWRKVETAVNNVFRELFVDGREGRIKITIDDDKVHYALSRPMHPFEPKAVQHVCDNRRGFVIDTAVYTASGVPVGLSTQGHGDTTAISARRVLQNQFAAADGGAMNTHTLTNVGLDLDRGFTTFRLAADVVSLGGSIDSSTCARNECWPVTYDQQLKSGDERVLMKKSGPKKVEQYTYYSAPSPVNADFHFHADRNGNNGVTLLLSTTHSGKKGISFLPIPRTACGMLKRTNKF